MNELKPCPFCGSSNVTLALEDIEYRRPQEKKRIAKTYGVKCADCYCRGATTIFDSEVSKAEQMKAQQMAIDSWNRRFNNERNN